MKPRLLTAALIYPHQLYPLPLHPALQLPATAARNDQLPVLSKVFLVEEPLFFTQYTFHRQKLMYHRMTMKAYFGELKVHFEHLGVDLHYVDVAAVGSHSGGITDTLRRHSIEAVQYVDPNDDWLATRLRKALADAKISSTVLPDNVGFLTELPESTRAGLARVDQYSVGPSATTFFNATFYMAQRKRLGILLAKGTDKPLGGKWSFDTENRKKLPSSGVTIPRPLLSAATGVTLDAALEKSLYDEARAYVRASFPRALGSDDYVPYAATRAAAAVWLKRFVDERLKGFGDYEDAISGQHAELFHSILTPMLNVGLLTPSQVVDAILVAFSEKKGAPSLNAVEGFVRQVIGWREFVRIVYRRIGRFERTHNFLQHTRPMPAGLYDGTTGITPVDMVIRRLLRTGYCHHIERLMVLGNFMLLCEIHPDAVYQWFMELFIDSYDWVMVPNVYGMSQFADGGKIVTKPYISGSGYICRMSTDVRKGDWCRIWDGLYWRFIHKHATWMAANPRMSLMVALMKKMAPATLEGHLKTANAFLDSLFSAGGGGGVTAPTTAPPRTGTRCVPPAAVVVDSDDSSSVEEVTTRRTKRSRSAKESRARRPQPKAT